tara:strand:+ start:1421 stop:1561 length:141 start_codon:yes stop_codon:yes gene_type:complete
MIIIATENFAWCLKIFYSSIDFKMNLHFTIWSSTSKAWTICNDEAV